MTRKVRLFSLAFMMLLSCHQQAREREATSSYENYMGEDMVQSPEKPSEQIYCDVLEQPAPKRDCELISKAAQVTEGSAAFNVPDPMQRGDRTSVTLVVDRRAPKIIRAIDMADQEHNAVETDDAAEPAINPERKTNGNATAYPQMHEENATEAMPSSTGTADTTETELPTPKEQTDKLPGKSDTYDLLVGRRMRADLTGQGFKIVRTSPDIQDIALNDQGTWNWEVIAEQRGPKTLTVTTVVEAAVNGHVYQLRQTKHLRTVTVGVSIPDQIKDWLRGLPDWLQLIAAILTALATVAGAWWLVKHNWRSGPTGADSSGGGAP